MVDFMNIYENDFTLYIKNIVKYQCKSKICRNKNANM